MVNHKWLGRVTTVIITIMIAMLFITNVAFAAAVSGTYSYASLCTTSYEYTSGQTGNVTVSGETFTLKAKGTAATAGSICSSGTEAVPCITTLTIVPSCDVKITANTGTGTTVTASGVNLGVETQVKGGTKVTFSVTADGDTEVNNTLTVILTEDDTNTYPSDCATYSILNGDGKTYYYLDEAIAVIPNGGTIVVGTTGTVYHSDHENGTKTIDIPAGVTLLLPRMPGETTVTGTDDKLHYANYDVWNKDSVSSLSTTDTNRQNIVLTIPNGMVVNNNGKIILGGSIASYSSYFSGGTQSQSSYYDQDAGEMSTETGHKHSDIKLNGTINMGSNSVLSAIGFITGKGTINANISSGAKIYQPFMIADYRGGNYVAGAGGKYGKLDYTVDTGSETIISPFVRYTMQNIQTTINIKSGNYMYGYCDMWASSQHNLTTACIIGDSNQEGLIKLTAGASVTAKYQDSNKVKHYDAFVDGEVNEGTRGGINGWGYNQIGRTKLTVTGGASLGNMSLDVEISKGNTVTMNMSSLTFPVPYNYDIYLNNGSYAIPHSMMLLPGASMTVGFQATLTVGDGSTSMRFMVMDGLFDHTRHGETSSWSTPTVTSEYEYTTDYTYPKTGELQTAGLSGTAILKLNGGSLIVNNGVMFGGLVQTDGTAGSQVSFNGTSGCEVRVGLVGSNSLRFAVAGATDRNLPARLMNGAGEYVEMTTGGIYKGIADSNNVINSYSFDLYTTSKNTDTKENYIETAGKTCDNCATCKLKYGSEAARCVCNIFSPISVSGMWYDHTLTVKEEGKDDVVYYHLNNKLYTADGEVTTHELAKAGTVTVTNAAGDTEIGEDKLTVTLDETAEQPALAFSNVALTEDTVVTVSMPCTHEGAVETLEVSATCEDPGTKAYWTCQNEACGMTFYKVVEDEVEEIVEIEDLEAWLADENGGLIPATGHSYAYVKLESVSKTYNSYKYACSCGTVGTFDDMMTEVGYQVQTLPEDLDFCAQGNLWDLLTPDEKYFYFGGTSCVPSWDDTYQKGDAVSVTIPVQPGMKIYANSFERSSINTSGYAGAFVTFYIQDENDGWTAQAWSREYVYKLVVTDKLGYITVPEGAVYANISHYKGIQAPVLLINHIYEKGSTADYTTPYSCATCNDIPSTMEEFQLLGGFTSQQLPEKFCDGRNLWDSFVKDESFYYVGNKTTSPLWNDVRGSDDMQAITFAVTPGTQIYATSFQAEANNGTAYVTSDTTTRNGTWVTYFMNNGTTVQMPNATTYSEYQTNGYITVPENAIGVQIAFYNNEAVPVEQELKILSHSYNDGKVVTAPDCGTEGEKIYTCSVCGGTKTEAIEALGHTYGTVIAAQPEVHTQTELKAGIAAHYQCSVCQTYFTADKNETTLEALTGETPTHTYGAWISTDPDNHWQECSVCGLKSGEAAHSDGDDDDQNCDTCGRELHTHDYSIRGEVVTPGTCQTETVYQAKCSCGQVNGTITGEKDPSNHTGTLIWSQTAETHKKTYDCCGAVTVVEENHEWTNGKCSECEYICEHKDEGKDHTCDYGCGIYQGEHKDSATDSDHVCDYGCGAVLENCTDVTTDKDHNCDVCSKENVTEHAYITTVTDPTCEDKGYTTHTCNCGDIYTDSYVDAAGHSLGDWIVDKEADCENAGSQHKQCANCDHTETEAIPAKGHTEGEVVEQNKVDPTYNTAGSYDSVTYCAVCKKELKRETIQIPMLTGAAAQIGETKYGTLTEALAVGGEVKLLADIQTETAFQVNKAVVLDLNGHNVKTTEEDTYGDGVFHVVAGGDLTINGEGEINGVGNNNYCIAVWADGGKVTINGGTYTNVGAGNEDHYDLIYVKNGGEVIINGGTFIAQTPAWTLNCHDASYKAGNATITVTGGVFHGFNPYNNAAEGANTNFVAVGKHASADENGVYTIHNCERETLAAVAPTCTETGLTEGQKCKACGETLVAQETVNALGHSFTNYVSNNDATFDKDGTKTAKCDRCEVTDTITDEGTKLTAVAKIGDQRYESLADAVAEAKKADTVILLADTTGAGMVIDKSITIDFGGHTYTFNKAVGSAGTATLGFQILRDNDVTLKNGTLTSAKVTEGKEVKVLIQNYANLILTDMDLTDNTDDIQYCLSNNSGEIALNGATNITTDAVAFDVYDYSAGGYEIPTMTVNTTGKIAGKIEVSETATLAISGGTFTEEIDESWCAEGYGPTNNGDGTYGVHEHSYKTVVTAPTCTENGYTTYTCHCGHSYTADEVQATGHTEETNCTRIENTLTHKVTVSCTVCSETIKETTENCADTDNDFACDTCGGLLVNAYTDAVTLAEEHTGTRTVEGATVTLKVTGNVAFAQAQGTGAWNHWVGFKITSPVDMSKVTILRPDNATRVMADIKDGDDYAYLYWGMTNDADKQAEYKIDWNGDGTYDLTVILDASGANLLECVHSWQDGEVTTPASCTTDGEMTYTCANCGKTKTEVIQATGNHSDSETDSDHICDTCNLVMSECSGGTATCEKKAVCTTCGAEYGELAEHTPGEAVEENRVESTCTVAGSYDSVVKCSVCGEELSRETKALELAAHVYDKEVATETYLNTAATCKDKATYFKSCTCGAKGTETFESGDVNPNNHVNTQAHTQTDATCTEAGYTAGTYCEDCNTWTGGHEKINALGHSYDEGVVTTEPTCTAAGVKTFTCENDATHTYTEVVAATGHSYSTKWSKDDTSHWCECSCGATSEMAAHTYGAWVVDKPATTTEVGSKYKTCSGCGYVVTAEIPVVEVELDPVINKTGSTTPAEVVVTTNDGKWKLGENTFTVSCDMACVVAYTEDGGESYQRIDAISVGTNVYSFSVELTSEKKIVICFAGDANSDSVIDVTDAVRIKAFLLDRVVLDGLQLVMGDANGDKALDVTDAVKIKAMLLDRTTTTWN